MTLSQIEQFVNVAELKNISKAAEKLYMNQSNLSSSIGKLEKELGVKLLKRSGNGVELTKDGSACLPYFKKILSNVKSINFLCMESKNNALQGKVTEQISIACTNYGFLPHTTIEYNQKNPQSDLRVSIVEMSGNMGLKMISENQVDFGIFTLYPFSEEEKMEQIKKYGLEPVFLGTARTGIYVRKDTPQANDNYVDFKKLEKLPFYVLRPGEIREENLSKYFNKLGIEFKYADMIRASSYSYILRSITYFDGFVFATEERKAGALMSDTTKWIPFDPVILPESKLYAVVRSDEDLRKPVSEYIKALQTVLSE